MNEELIINEKKQTEWHTGKWYKQYYGVNPEETEIPPKLVENPYYRTAPRMKLWKETEMRPYRNDDGVQRFQTKSAAGKKAFQTKRNNIVNWWQEKKQENPEIRSITQRLWKIHNQIGKLHHKKEMCRGCYAKWDIEHICSDCDEWSGQQDDLREEREDLFVKLEELTEKPKEKIQEARNYQRQLNESLPKMEGRA